MAMTPCPNRRLALLWALGMTLAIPAGTALAAPAPCVPRLRAEVAVDMAHGVPLVSMTIDGVHVSLVLDTGAERTLLTTAAVRQLGLAEHNAYVRTVAGLGGRVTAGEVRPKQMAAGALALTGYSLLVAGVTLPGLGGRPVDGLLGADLLGDFDLDVDLAHHVVGFYEPATCDAPALPWSMPYQGIAAHWSLHRHLFFGVRLDGTDMAAFFDTGASWTTVNSEAAARAGLTAAAMQRDRPITVHGLAASADGAHLHRFAALEIGGVVMADTPVIVTRLNLDDADAILGGDVLATHRVWLAYGLKRVFVAAHG